MSGLFRNRLSGASAREPGSAPLLGLWRMPDPGGADVFLNSAPVEEGAFLVPDLEGQWVLLAEGGTRRQSGAFGGNQLPEELESETLRGLGEKLQGFIAQGAGWLEWMGLPPLVSGMSEKADLQELEKAIRKHLGHLENVCRKPRAHLRVEIERTPVSRARRVPPQAVNYLAAHTEDWERRTVQSIVPRRVLALVREEQLDIYENRVVARLIDRLLAYVHSRINDVRKVHRFFERTRNYTDVASRGSRWRKERVFALWGKSFDMDEEQRKAQETLKELDRLKYKLMGLTDSTLYAGVPRRANVPDTLSLTNILTNDPHYRHVAELWREWFARGRPRKRGPREIYQRAQQLCGSFDGFGLLLTIHALVQLHYEPRELDAPLRPGTRLGLFGPDGEAVLSWEADGTFSLSSGPRCLRVVPLAALLASSPDPAVTRRHLDELIGMARGSPDKDTLILYPTPMEERNRQGETGESGRLDESTQRRLHTIGNDLVPARKPGPWMLPAAPWDIGSVERVARALRWFLSRPRFLEYPPKLVAPPAGVLPIEGISWLRRKDKHVELIRPPVEHEWEQLGLQARVQRARETVEHCEALHQRASEQAREAAKRGQGTTAANALKHTRHAELTEARQAWEQAQSLLDALEPAIQQQIQLLRCPTCKKEIDRLRDFRSHLDGTFLCQCPECETRWGTRSCQACGERLPLLLPRTPSGGDLEEGPDWVDRLLGGDVLAIPCARSAELESFICSACGACPCAVHRDHPPAWQPLPSRSALPARDRG